MGRAAGNKGNKGNIEIDRKDAVYAV